MKRALLIILSVLVADQVLKVWVKLNFFYDSAIPILGDKGYLHFIENRGMAFGMEFGGEWGKLVLTLFRIAAVSHRLQPLPHDQTGRDHRTGR
ncbi:MAG: signal peptidase II [Flavobacteriales bacterium]